MRVLHARIWALLRRLSWRITDRFPLNRSNRVKPPGQPHTRLKVGFIVCSSTKWGLDSVISELRTHCDVDYGFYVALSDLSQRYKKEERRNDYVEQRAFFAQRGPIWADLYDAENDRVLSTSQIKCDVAFIQQPWGMQELPRVLARRMRCAYVHYGMPVITNDRMHSGLPDFHPFLWRYFASSTDNANIISEGGLLAQHTIRNVGHPKLDIYSTPAPKRDRVLSWPNATRPDRKRVIFAPHHSVGNSALKLGTFDWSGKTVLELTKQYPQVDFILRPHPNLGYEISRTGLMTSCEWLDYLDIWAKGFNTSISSSGEYFDIFRTSDAMITDSGSFLAEYLPTGKPLIRLMRRDSAPLNKFGASLSRGFIEAYTTTELEQVFKSVIIMGANPCAKNYAALSKILMPGQMSAATSIIAELRNSLVRHEPPPRTKTINTKDSHCD